MSNAARAFRYLEARSERMTVFDMKYRVAAQIERDVLEIHGCLAEKHGEFWLFWPEHYPPFLQHEDEVQNVTMQTRSEYFLTSIVEETEGVSGKTSHKIYATNDETGVTLVQTETKAYARKSGQKLLSAPQLSHREHAFRLLFLEGPSEALRSIFRRNFRVEHFQSDGLSPAFLAKNWRGDVVARRKTIESLADVLDKFDMTGFP